VRTAFRASQVSSTIFRAVTKSYSKSAVSSLLASRKNFQSSGQNVACRFASSGTQLADFLQNEIEQEKQIAKSQNQQDDSFTKPPDGFKCEPQDSAVTLTKAYKTEKITITFNVNDTVGAGEPSGEENQPEEPSTMVARPDFRVAVSKGKQGLIFMCEFIDDYQNSDDGAEPAADEPPEPENMFSIRTVWIENEGDKDEHLYAVSGDILDGAFYDQLIDYLAERGIDDAFARQLQGFATHYEHAQYVNLLQKVKDFLTR